MPTSYIFSAWKPHIYLDRAGVLSMVDTVPVRLTGSYNSSAGLSSRFNLKLQIPILFQITTTLFYEISPELQRIDSELHDYLRYCVDLVTYV